MVRWDDELVAQIYTQADRQEDQTNGARSLEHFDEFRGNFERSSVEFWKSSNALKGAWGNLERSLKETENELEENLRRLKKSRRVRWGVQGRTGGRRKHRRKPAQRLVKSSDSIRFDSIRNRNERKYFWFSDLLLTKFKLINLHFLFAFEYRLAFIFSPPCSWSRY